MSRTQNSKCHLGQSNMCQLHGEYRMLDAASIQRAVGMQRSYESTEGCSLSPRSCMHRMFANICRSKGGPVANGASRSELSAMLPSVSCRADAPVSTLHGASALRTQNHGVSARSPRTSIKMSAAITMCDRAGGPETGFQWDPCEEFITVPFDRSAWDSVFWNERLTPLVNNAKSLR